MQLGVIHALMVSDRRAPDAIAGVSAGALNAAAMAEVLREPREQQVGRLREFLNAYRDAPREFRMAFLPDTYELEAQRPLESLKLPIHCAKEREERDEAVGAKTGLIHLFNMLFSLRIPVSIVSRLIHSGLKISAAAEKPWLKRILIRWGAWAEILAIAFFNLHRVAPVSWQILRALAHPVIQMINARMGSNPGVTAGSIISFRRRALSNIRVNVSHFIGYAASLIVWMCAFSLWLLAPFVSLLGLILGFAARPLVRIWRYTVGEQPLTMGQRFLRKFLSRFDLDREIANAYPIKQFLVRLFDPQYYGALQLNEVKEQALSDDERPVRRGNGSCQTLRQYTEGSPSIHVAPVVTTLKEPKLYIPPPDTSVVEALLAATAVVPFFKPVELNMGRCRSSLCIDAVNVANEPIPALVDYLRNCSDLRDKVANASSVHIYAVSSIPTTRASLRNGHHSYSGLVDTALRVLELRRFQTAALERKLTQLYTRLLPSRGATHRVGDKTFLSTHIFPIEPDSPTRVNERLALAKTEEEKDTIIYETVASGCRSALQVLIQPLIRGARGAPSCMISCRKAMTYLEHPRLPLPGSDPEGGPGLAEICAVCRIAVEGENGGRSFPQTLRILQDKPESSDRDVWPLWPHKEGSKAPRQESTNQRAIRDGPPKTTTAAEAPQSQPILPGDNRTRLDSHPWTIMLFSGGVFRGVFQVGVLNALVQTGVSPKVFAGSSVGSIMAAMAVRLFDEASEEREAHLLKLASTFLALDRLILTDRFADFVRRITIRSASARVSFQDMDQLFRRYDTGAADQFDANARRVMAGIERLLYVSPFELLELVKAIRLQQSSDALILVRRYLQEFLERYDTGQEVLGAEPLAMLIAEHVLRDLKGKAEDYYVNPHRAPFDLFRGEEGKFLITTTTNLTTGGLTTIGQRWMGSTGNEASLMEALLASSAFPAVFRPRRSSELFPTDQTQYQYVDGGIMDNLPLDAVVSFLDNAARAGKLMRRPGVPHLLLSGSLEPELVPLDKRCVRDVSQFWPVALKRARQLSYNRKADTFAQAQKDFRRLYNDEALRKDRSAQSWEPLDIEVLNVKPKWLCSTFGFHPMLGFRRRKQAASIAHGCASTLLSLHHVESDAYRKAWGIELRFDPDTIEGAHPQGGSTLKLVPHDPTGKKRENGWCWFRSDRKVCPFSKQGIEFQRQEERYDPKGETTKELQLIYELCGQSETHAPR
jgi:predicted acylesterase/phospholipase RssA